MHQTLYHVCISEGAAQKQGMNKRKESVSMLQNLNNQNKSSVMSMQDKSFLPDEMLFFHNIHEMHFNGTHCRTDIYASGIRARSVS